MLGISLFKRTCSFCGRELENPLEAEVPVPGYTEKRKKHFCSEEHAHSYAEAARIRIKNSPRVCGTC